MSNRDCRVVVLLGLVLHAPIESLMSLSPQDITTSEPLVQALATARTEIQDARLKNFTTGDRQASTKPLTYLLRTLPVLATRLERAGMPEKAAECHVAIGDLLQLQGRGAEAVEALAAAVEKAEAAGATEILLEALYLEGTVRFLVQDDRILPGKRVERVLELTRTRRADKWRAYALSLRAELEQAANRLDDARASIKLALGEGVQEPRFLFFAWYDLYSICWQRVGQIELRNFTVDDRIYAAESVHALRQAVRIANEQGWEYLSTGLRPLAGNVAPYVSFMVQYSAQLQALEGTATMFLQSPRNPDDVHVGERFCAPTELTMTTAETAEIMEKANQNPDNRRDVLVAAAVAAVNNDHELAFSLYQKAVTLLERDYRRLPDDPTRTALHSVSTSYYYPPMLLCLDRNDLAGAFAYMEKARAAVLNDIIMTRASIELADPAQTALYRRLHQLREALVATPASTARATTLEGEYQQLLERARKEHPELLSLVAAPSVALEDAHKATQAGFDILEYVCLDGQLVVFHIGPSGIHVRSITAFRKSLTEKVASIRRSLVDPRIPFDESVSRELYLGHQGFVWVDVDLQPCLTVGQSSRVSRWSGRSP